MSKYENHNLKNSEIPFIYKQNYVSFGGDSFWGSNWHENIEILSITDGEGRVLDNTQSTRVKKGDVIIINSNHVHALSSSYGNMSFRYLIIDRSFCLQNGIDTNMLCFEPFLGNDEKLNALLDELDLTYSSDDMFSIPRTRSVALNILLYICERHGTLAQKNESATGSASAVKKAIDYIHASYRNDFSLDDVAEFIGINKYYLSHEFSKYTGYSFVAYVNRTRCKNACRLLEEGNMNISEVGKMCGLENRSYFAKCFKKNVGVLPSEYAKRVCANNDKILSTNIYKKN